MYSFELSGVILSFPASLQYNSPCIQLFAVHVLSFLLFSMQAHMILG